MAAEATLILAVSYSIMLVYDIGTLERKAFGVDADQIPDFWGCPDGVRSMMIHDTLILYLLCLVTERFLLVANK